MKSDEFFVIEAVAKAFGGKWRSGEDPPDAYLEVPTEPVAVEISTLTQRVPDGKGGSKPRWSEDATALWLVKEVKAELRSQVPEGRTVILTLASPILKARKAKMRLTEIIRQYLSDGRDTVTAVDVYGNHIEIAIKAHAGPDPEKIHGIISNKKSDAHILRNAVGILEDRIRTKAEKCSDLPFKGALWLALFNDYWLADDDTYRQALAMISAPHPFERILIVSSSGAVTTL